MDKELVKMSLDESDSFSSHTHLLEKNDKQPVDKNYEIPSEYGVDRVCLLSVNVNTLHTYWELTPALFHQNGLDEDTNVHFFLKNEDEQTVYEFSSNQKMGKYYIDIEPKLQELYLEVGCVKEGAFIPLLRSNKVKSFNTQIIYPKQSDMKWLSIKGGFKEVIYSTMMHFSLGMSSQQYKEEIAFLEEFEDLDIKSFSSKEVAKDKR